MEWRIMPLVGAGPLRLGMTDLEVSNILDHKTPVQHKFCEEEDNTTTEGRGANQVTCRYKSNRLSGIIISKNVANASYQDIDIFTADPKFVLRAFSERNHLEGRFKLGNMIFREIGINCRGYLLSHNKYFSPRNVSNENDERGIGVFDKEEFADPFFDDFDIIKF